MATATKPSQTTALKQPDKKPQDSDQLRRDRMVAVVTVVVMMILMAVLVWLASLGGGGEVENFDFYHPMMP